MSPTIPGTPNPIRVPEPDPLAGTGAFLWTWRACVYGALVLALILGGAAVRVAALAGALLVPLADRGGAARHLLHVVGALVGLAAIPLFGIPFGHALSPHLGGPLGLLIGTLAVFLAAVAAAALVGRRFSRRLRRHRYLYVLDRSGGTLLGVVEGALVAAMIAWMLHLLGPAIRLYGDRVAVSHPSVARVLTAVDSLAQGMLEEDALGRWAADVNPLMRVPSVRTIAAAAEVTADREAFWQAFDDGVFDDLLGEPAVHQHFLAFRSDTVLRRAVKVRDLTTLLSSRQFAAAMHDDEFCKAVAKHWPEIRARATDAKVARLRQLTAKLDAPTRAKLQQAERRANQFGVRVP